MYGPWWTPLFGIFLGTPKKWWFLLLWHIYICEQNNPCSGYLLCRTVSYVSVTDNAATHATPQFAPLLLSRLEPNIGGTVGCAHVVTDMCLVWVPLTPPMPGELRPAGTREGPLELNVCLALITHMYTRLHSAPLSYLARWAVGTSGSLTLWLACTLHATWAVHAESF